MINRSRIFFYIIFYTFISLIYSLTLFAQTNTYDGEIISLSTVKIYGGFDNEYKGIVTFTPLPGTLFKGPILDFDGNIIEKGDILFKMKTEYRDAQMEQALAVIEKDQAALDSAEALYASSKKLYDHKSGAISEIDYINAKNKYYEALSQLKTDKANLILAERMKSICTYYARFDGIVDKVYFPYGYIGNFGEPTLEVSQLSPIAVKIKMSRKEALSLGPEIPVSVYPVGNNSKPIGVFIGQHKLTKKGIEYLIPNYISTPKTKKIVNGKEIPVINKISAVVSFNLNPDSNELALNKDCLQKDKKGYFVYKAEDRKTGIPGVGFNPLIKIQKVYVVPGNKINPIGANADLILLKKNGSLKIYDVILYPSEIKDLKNTDTVYYLKKRYLFMPGDKVKVKIENMK